MGNDHGLALKVNRADKAAMEAAAGRWRSVMKPLGSLGELEGLVIKLAGIFGRDYFSKRIRTCVLVACADNGVVREGISQSDSSVTRVVAEQIALGLSNINVMSESAGADVFVADFGMAQEAGVEGVLDLCVRRGGTGNIAEGPAMSMDEAVSALNRGRELVAQMKARGYSMVVTGEMGIGNTTTSSALSSVLLDLPAAEVTGRGAGLSSERLAHKIETVEKAVKVNSPFSDDPIELISKLGGFDIAAMCGMFLGGMETGIPVVIDGFISAVSALLASRIEPSVKDFMLPSHLSAEASSLKIFEELGMKPVINAAMRLGEGTGGVCLLPLLNIALAEYGRAHRFGDREVEQYVEYE